MITNENSTETHITLKIVDLPGLDDIIGVGQAGPVVKVGSVVGIINLDLTFLGQLNRQQVHWEVELGLGLVEVLLVKSITSNPS